MSDALEHIMSFLGVADRYRFSAVCHYWRVVAKRRRHPPPAEMPWLVLGEDSTTKKRNFFNLSEQRHYSIDIPELYGHYICGSSYGWLFTVDKRINARLLNPFTREFYALPPLPPFDETYKNGTHICTAEPVFNSRGRRTAFTFDEMQERIVTKAVLSHDPREGSDFILFIIVGMPRKLAIWRPGDTVWTFISGPCGLSDVISFDGTFYALHCNLILFAIDVGYDPKVTTMSCHPYLFRKPPIGLCLLDLRGKLLVVQMLKYNAVAEDPIELCVLHYNMKEPGLCELHAIDDLALFVGSNSALVFDPSKNSGCVENGIYFADMAGFCRRKVHGHDLGVYDVVDKMMRQFCPGDELFHPTDAVLTWLSPNP
ncbi:hypothetical protein LUZ60_005469 [Juncus effusus]|nr:hypothetical protein LUZ60_005469 [Juncus effusus]